MNMPAPAPAVQESRPSRQFQSIWKDMQKAAGKSRNSNEVEPADVAYGMQNGQIAEVQDVQPEQNAEQAIGAYNGMRELAQDIVSQLGGFELLDVNAEGTEMTDEDMQWLIKAYDAAMEALEGGVQAVEENPQQKGQAAQLPVPVREALEALAAKYVKAAEARPVEEGIGESPEAKKGEGSLLETMQPVPLRPVKGVKDEKTAGDDMPFQQQMEQAPVAVQAQPRSVETPSLTAEAEPLPLTAAETADNLHQIIDKISASAIDGQQEFEVQLKPEFLGKLSIKLVMDSDGLRAQIKAADMTARDMIHTQLPGLEAALKERGVDVRQIEVTYEAVAFDFNQQQQPNGGKNEYVAPSRTVRYAGGLEAATYDAILEQTGALEYLHENSSVEFQA